MTAAELVLQRPAAFDGDVHFCESLAQWIIEEFTQPDQLVLDPFAGFGTTLAVAVRLGRQAIGVELLEDRFLKIVGRVGSAAEVICGDTREVVERVAPSAALCFTSPPYMTSVGHHADPLTGYQSPNGNCGRYLHELAHLFNVIGLLLRPGGHVVINVADPVGVGRATPLVNDLRRAVAAHLKLRESITVEWDRPPAHLGNDTCLVFARP